MPHLLLLQYRKEGLDRVDWPPQIDVENPLPVAQFHVSSGRRQPDASVTTNHIHLTKLAER